MSGLGPDLITLVVGALSVVITRLLDNYLPGKVEPVCPPGRCWVLRQVGPGSSPPPIEEK